MAARPVDERRGNDDAAMKRSQVSLRSAVPTDAPALAEIWCDVLRRCEADERIQDLVEVIERVAGTDAERIVVAEYDGQVAGAVHLRATTLTPINLEPVVQAISPHVLPRFRRHGVGRALMECAVAFAEERGIGHVATAAIAGARDANRFMARLALSPHALLRLAPTGVVRSKLSTQGPVVGRTTVGGGRQLTHVLAARRSLRRQAAAPPARTQPQDA
jgi:predicted N-acetyltransferase YhbS